MKRNLIAVSITGAAIAPSFAGAEAPLIRKLKQG
jgi:hypothetical protein